MNILELDSYNLADAVKFHDRLNHRLWDRSEHLHPQVHAKLMEIARDFQEFLGVPDLDIKDITISGSNAAYNYTPNSDIDLHLVVDLPEADSSEVYRELFDAKKFQYNETHNITIGGYDVELYVQNPNQEHHSQGIYSLLRNAWVSVPRRKKANIDDISTRSKYEDLVARIDATIATGNYERLSELMKKIRAMRQSGLEQQGEFGADNLAFKMLRNNGYIKRLVNARNAARDLELSLAELAQPRPRVQYGFMSESPDGVNPSTKMFLDESDVDSVLPKFFDNCIDFLGIQNAPEMVLHNNTDWSESTGSFGQFDPDANVLHLATSGRHVLDILRTMAHELTHCRQNEKHPLPDNAGETGSRWEDQANAMAGRIMRHWAEEHPEMFKDVSLEESASGYIPRNKKEAQDPRYSMALSVDIKPGQVGREANKLALNTGRNGEPGLLMKSANLRESRMPQPSQGPGKYRDLNTPLGPESPPTMPKGTVRVDVSDVYDWYKLGQHISNMKGMGKHDFGSGPPSSIISFGDEETEHKFIKDLEATGLDVTDIDPKDPQQPQGMRKIKTDPTYNVSEGVLEDNMAANDKSIADIRSKLTLVPFFTNPKTNTPVWVYDNSGRYTVVVQYGNMNLPFYYSTGMGGKETVAADQWYPFFGVGTGPKGWINKGSEEQINNYYGSGILKNISKFLDSTFIPRRDPKNVWGWGMNRGLEDEFKKVVNRNFPETQDSSSRREGFTIDGFARNVNPYLKSLGGMQYGTSDSSTDTKTKTDAAPPPSKPTPAPTVGKEIAGPLTLQHNGKEFTTLSISTNLGRNSVRQLGDDYKFWHDDQFQLQKDNKDNTWTLIPNNAATNKTIINGQGVTTPVKLKQGMVISVGNPAKKIEKLPITVISKPGVAENALAESLRQELSLFEEQDLFEINMSPSSLRREAAKTGAIAGMEFEMIVPNVEGGDDGDLEPDYEYDERCRSIEDAVNFFHDGDYNGRREVERLREKMQNDFQEWLDDKIYRDWERGGEEYLEEWVPNNVDESEWNPDDLEGEARTEALEVFIASMHADPGSSDAFDEFREENEGSYDESDWLDDQDLDLMSGVENAYSMSWPHWTSGGGGEAEISDVAQEFENAIGRDTWASNDYHSSGTLRPSVANQRYIVEPDGSLDGDNPGDRGLEFVSPPLPIDEILSDLNKVKAWAREYGCYTNDSTGLHINISVPDYSRENLDFVKLALLMGDQYVLEAFGRTGNTYAKSALGIIKDAVRNKPEDAARLLDKMKGNLDQLATKAIHSGSTSKYTSINTKDGHIEFRSPGGDWLDDNFDKIENTLLRFTVAMSAALNPDAYRQEYLTKLYKLLSENNEGDDTIKYFSDYVAGKIPAAALRSFVKQARLERKLKKGDTEGKKYWWSVGRPGYGASAEVVASNKEEAIAKGKQEYPDWASAQDMTAKPLRPYQEPETTQAASGPTLNGRPSNPDGNYVIVDMTDETKPVYRYMAVGAEDALLVLRQWIQANPGQMLWNYKFDPNQTLGQPASQSGTDTSQTDIENRLGWGSQTADANYEIVYRGSNPPQRRFVFIANTPAEAARKFDRWLAAQGLPANTEDYGFREIARPGSTLDLQRQRAQAAQQDDIPEIPLDIEQNFPQASSAPAGNSFSGQWKVMIDGEEVWRFRGVGNNQADANRIAQTWILDQIRQGSLSPVDGANVEVLPVMI